MEEFMAYYDKITTDNADGSWRPNEKAVVKQFEKWAAAWEAPRGVGDSGLRGDEINVGDLWEDKSQKDFKSYL